MFNVVIENETFSNIDPLIIKEDINNIIQSIEEQLYNINISYRNNVRKIKNSLKSLEGITESELIILEEAQIDDSNLISYLTNVLEISVDCIVSTLYENKEYRSQIKNVKNVNNLIDIESKNTELFSNILEEYKELCNIYSQINEIKVSNNIYELLNKSIERSVNSNIDTHVPQDIKFELEIYNKVIENLDNLVGDDLIGTYDNIKLFAASNTKQVNEGFINWIVTKVQYGQTHQLRFVAIFASLVGSIVWAFTYIGGKTVNVLDYVWNAYFKDVLSAYNWGDLSEIMRKVVNDQAETLSMADLNKLMITYHNLGSSIDDENKKEVLGHLFYKYDIEKLFANVSSSFHDKVNAAGEIQQNFDRMNTLNQNMADLNQTMNITIADAKSTIENYINEIRAVTAPINQDMQVLMSELEQYKSLTYGTIGGLIGLSLLIIGFLYKKQLPNNFKLETIKFIKTSSAIEKAVNTLKERVLRNFPELKIQFNVLDAEINKCKDYAKTSKEASDLTNCMTKYTIGTYSIILYFALIQLKKDGNDLSRFNSLTDIHNFNGFSSFKTKSILSELNDAYNIIIKQDAELVKLFINAFNLIKRDITENNSVDTISTRLLSKF